MRIIIVLFYFSLFIHPCTSQEGINLRDFDNEIRKNIGLFESTVRYVANCKTLKSYRNRKREYIKDIFVEDAIIEVLPSPGKAIVTCDVASYFKRVMGYCDKYDLTIINFTSLVEPKEFVEIIYEGKIAYSGKAIIRQCTSFYKITSSNKEIPDVALIKPEECTDKVLDFIIHQRVSALGLSYTVKLKSIKVIDGKYVKR